MSYGILIRNTNNEIVLDEENSAVIVHEQGSLGGAVLSSITSTYQDFQGKWYGGVPVRGGTTRRNWSTNYVLSKEYENPPIVAMRCGYNVKLPTCEVYSHNPTNSGYYNKIRFRHESPTSVQFIVCADAASAPNSAKTVGSETYGISIKDGSSPQQDIFDSRWASLVAATGVYDYPTMSSSSGLFTFTSGSIAVPPTIAQNTASTQTIVDTPAAFIAPTFSGFIEFEEVNFDISAGEDPNPPQNLNGGGDYRPAIMQTNATTIAHTTIRHHVGTTVGTLGTIDRGSYASLKGSYLVLRYLNYT